MTLSAQGVLIVDFIQKVTVEEVIGEPEAVTEALKRTAQVARVVQVPNACETKTCVVTWLAKCAPLAILDLKTLALFLVVRNVE